jgi:hypothetical protein
VNPINAATLRRLIPAAAVAAVLAFSYLAPLPSAASSVGGFGYNCGVKGYGYHDHGKVCPNRPFPGQGNGITKFLSNGTSTSVGHGKGQANDNSSPPISDETTTATSEISPSAGKGHAWGRGHAKGKGQLSS